jgi:hypothetical protein
VHGRRRHLTIIIVMIIMIMVMIMIMITIIIALSSHHTASPSPPSNTGCRHTWTREGKLSISSPPGAFLFGTTHVKTPRRTAMGVVANHLVVFSCQVYIGQPCLLTGCCIAVIR